MELDFYYRLRTLRADNYDTLRSRLNTLKLVKFGGPAIWDFLFFFKVINLSAPSSHQVGSKSLKVMKQKSVGSNDSQNGVSLLRQKLEGTLCSTKYKKAQETLCKDCNQPYTTKCLLQVCRKSDEVLCPRCGQELTAKCLLQSCSERPHNSY